MKTVLMMNLLCGVDSKDRRVIRLVIDGKSDCLEERQRDHLGDPAWVELERDSDSAGYIGAAYVLRIMLRCLAVGLAGGTRGFAVVGNDVYRSIDLGDVSWADHHG
jgi:hypothetical protein